MSRLPSISDLGPANPGPGERPVGQIDATSLGRGYEQLGSGLEKLGGGLSELDEAQTRQSLALAHAGLTSDMISLNANTQQDLNYGPDANGANLPQRYQAQASQIRDKWGATIDNPYARERFNGVAGEQIAQGQAQADTHAKSLYRDHQVAAVDTLGETLGNQAVATDDPNVHTKVMDAYGGAVDGLAGAGLITQDEAVKRKRAFGGNVAQGLLLQQAQTDPQGALNHIRSAPGSDDELVERIIQVESGGKASARNANSSAGGLGQFTDQTWLNTLKTARPDLAKTMSDDDLLALKADPNLNRQMTGVLLQQNRSSLQAQGLPGTAGNLYLAHFAGAGGAAKLLKASPDTPVSQILAPDAIAANPGVLAGRTAGSVVQWANGRMGGYAPGEGSIYSFIPPAQRAQLESRLLGMTQARTAGDQASFRQAVDDTQAEANRTGDVQKPLQMADFVKNMGADAGPGAYKTYAANLQLGRDVAGISTMAPEQMSDLVTSYEPKPGPGFAAAAERQDAVKKAVFQSLNERSADPAGFAVSRLPGTRAAYSAYSQATSDPTVDEAQRGVAARSFAATTLLEQQGAGIPPGQRQILPQADIERFKTTWQRAATSDSPAARTGLIATVQAEQRRWGSYWPQVVQQLSPSMQPMVKAIAAGADPAAMTRLLALDPKENPAALLKEQSETKAKDVQSSLNTAMAPLLSTMVGRQKDSDFVDYYNMASKLAALNVRDGQDATTAAQNAFNALIGNRYDFRDTYRIPKDSGVAADDVQAGALVAKQQLEALGARPAIDDIGGLSDAKTASLAAFKRDGTWVTSPDNGGLNLMYGDKSVKDAKGAPLFLSWGKLAQLGGTPEARAAAAARETETSLTP